MSDIFNLDPEDFKEPEKQRKTSFYVPDPEKAADKVYKAVIRFIPNIANPKESTIKKTTCWLETDGQGFSVDDPSSIGEKSIISDVYWKLKKSSSAYDVSQSDRIKRKKSNFSYVYIVKDLQRPELNGTVQIFKYGDKIKTMIDNQLKVEVELGDVPVNVFDLFNGKDFQLKVKILAGFRNYDDSKFSDSVSPISIDGVKMERNPACMETIKAIYKNVEPLETFSFRPWDAETTSKVLGFLKEISGSLGNKIISSPKQTQSKTMLEEVDVESTNEATPVEQSEEMDDEIQKFLSDPKF